MSARSRRTPGLGTALAEAAALFRDLEAVGIELGMVNLGGGFLARHRARGRRRPPPTVWVVAAVRRHFGNRLPS